MGPPQATEPGCGAEPRVRMIRGVFFDLDGTLYDRDASIRRVVELQFEAFRAELPAVSKTQFIERLLELDGHGHNRPLGLYQELAQELGFDGNVADRLEADFRSSYFQSCRLFPDTLQTLDELRGRGKKIGVITNGPTHWQQGKLDALGLASLFDTILISEIEGVQKPDPRIFARALERCGVRASESIFVGDHPHADIAGAKAAGLLPVWKRVPYWKVPDDVLSVGALKEILPLCS
jgi:putative hydrolase of the HAD superfamily